MDRDLLRTSIAQGEGTCVEFKLRPPKTLRLARSVCAFANTSGGIVILGVDDRGGIVGVDSVDEGVQALKDCLALIRPQPDLETWTGDLDGRPLVVGVVAQGDAKPYAVISERGAVAYIRAGATVRPLADPKRLADEDELRQQLRIDPLQRALMHSIGREGGVRIGVLAGRHNLSRQRALRLLVPLIKAGLVVEKDGGYILR